MRLLLDALLYVVLVFTAIPSEQASGVVVTSQGSSNTPPSTSSAMSPGCPRSCGNLTFDYPFGIGSNCFKSPDFSLTCDNTTQTPRIYFQDSITEVVDDIDVSYEDTEIPISLSQAMPMIHGVSTYNMSWKTAGRAFTLFYAHLNITGCDSDVYRIYQDTNASVKLCTVTCPDEEITDKVARQNCNGTGCCSVKLNILQAFQLQFVLHTRGELGTHTNRSSLWESINVTSADAVIVCYDGLIGRLDPGYICSCDGGYWGNPYILNGCSRDKDIDECDTPGICRGVCQNTPGGYNYIQAMKRRKGTRPRAMATSHHTD